MAITKEQKEEFNENLTDFKVFLESLKKDSSLYKTQLRKSKKLEPYFYTALAIDSVKFINTCLLINEMSVHIMDLKSENYMNQGRKEIYNAFSYIEKAVGSDYENGLDENRDLLDRVTTFNPIQRLNLIKSLKKGIDDLVEAYGSGSKWKWSWPELYFKLAVVSKNLMDWRAFEAEADLDNPYYYPRREHFNLVIEFSSFAAQEYRTKYDLSTQDVSELKKSIALLEMNRKIFQITGETDDMEKTKNLIESLKEKVEELETDKTKKKKK